MASYTTLIVCPAWWFPKPLAVPTWVSWFIRCFCSLNLKESWLQQLGEVSHESLGNCYFTNDWEANNDFHQEWDDKMYTSTRQPRSQERRGIDFRGRRGTEPDNKKERHLSLTRKSWNLPRCGWSNTDGTWETPKIWMSKAETVRILG